MPVHTKQGLCTPSCTRPAVQNVVELHQALGIDARMRFLSCGFGHAVHRRRQLEEAAITPLQLPSWRRSLSP